jgi:hypothetical protein
MVRWRTLLFLGSVCGSWGKESDKGEFERVERRELYTEGSGRRS